jgi:cysteine-rich repeat protein
MAEAVCGDGFVQAGAEDCDDMNVEDLDACNNACASPRWVFVTSKSPIDSGNLGGVAGADAYCQMYAENASLSGTYMAWLTGMDPASAPATRFTSTEFKGWYLLPSEPPTPVALGWADLTSPNDDMPENYLQNAISVDENGKSLGNGFAWTNTKADGTQFSPMEHCGTWTSDVGKGSSGNVNVASLGAGWTDNEPQSCGVGLRLYCFQVE